MKVLLSLNLIYFRQVTQGSLVLSEKTFDQLPSNDKIY